MAGLAWNDDLRVDVARIGANCAEVLCHGLGNGLFVYQATMVDGELPVEVLRGHDGVVEAVRMCFTDDVDGLEGSWSEIGVLDLPNGHCMACDPLCAGSGRPYRLEIDVRPGRYRTEVFDYTHGDGSRDVLGLRMIITEPRVVA